MLAYLPMFPSKIRMANQHFWIHKTKNLNKIHKMLIAGGQKSRLMMVKQILDGISLNSNYFIQLQTHHY